MQALLPIAYFILFIFLIYKMKFFEIATISKTQLASLFVLKLIAAGIVWLVYTHYYHFSDFQNYFENSSKLIHNVFGGQKEKLSDTWNGSFESVLFSSSRLMIILNSILHLFSFGNFIVHAIFFCFFSFTEMLKLVPQFPRTVPSNPQVNSYFLSGCDVSNNTL